MKSTFIIGALAATVGVGSAAYMLLADDEPAADDGREHKRAKGKRRAPQAQAPVEDRSDWEMEDRVAELESEVAALRRQVKAIQLRAGAPAAFGGGDETLELDDPEVADSVREIVAEEREREREQEMERRRTRAQERMNEALDELVAEANISSDQREKIAALWTEERDHMSSLFAQARGGDRDFREVREQARQMRKSVDEQAKAVLSDEQYAAYEQLRPRGRGGRGPDGGGGPRGRPGPPGGP